jgi:hypothetical protein
LEEKNIKLQVNSSYWWRFRKRHGIMFRTRAVSNPKDKSAELEEQLQWFDAYEDCIKKTFGSTQAVDARRLWFMDEKGTKRTQAKRKASTTRSTRWTRSRPPLRRRRRRRVQ